ncbi:uncharacterized protein [Rutidosis leptorrhynchoides]|uniref:uncharacterized protein n=1 Tax=Rutidosis leptorrhynchoides TaxID=125765 RepID=UPI003A996EAA
MVIWDKGVFEFDSYTCGEFFLAIRGKWKNSGLESIIVNVYGPHNDRGKKLLWESLDVLLNSVSSAWLLCGDFNELRISSYRLNSQFRQGRADRFKEFILRNNLIEIPISGRKFTRISDDGIKFNKLDMFLVTNNFLGLWEDLSIIDRNLSDHCPLVLRDRIFDYGPKPFKVFNEWFNFLDVEDVIRDAWNQPIRGSKKDCIFRDRLKNVKMALRSWSKSKCGGLDFEIEELKKETLSWELKAECQSLSDSVRASWLECRRKWVEKEKIKTSMLKQKARIKWSIDGDENSKYFHASIHRKYNKCNFRGINVDGVWIDEPNEVKEIIFKHFQNQFNSTNSSRSIFNCGPHAVGPNARGPPGQNVFVEGSNGYMVPDCFKLSETESFEL